MAFSLKDRYKNLDFDQKNILQATGCSLLFAVLLFLICPTPDGFFISYCVLSWMTTYVFSWRNRTKYSKKKFRSKNGKVFSLKESKRYWVFLFIMIPVTFLIAGPLPRLVSRSFDPAYCIVGMALLQMFCSRIYLFRKKIPLRAFTLTSGPRGVYYNHRRASSKFISEYNSPVPSPGNAFGTIGPFRHWHRR